MNNPNDHRKETNWRIAFKKKFGKLNFYNEINLNMDAGLFKELVEKEIKAKNYKKLQKFIEEGVSEEDIDKDTADIVRADIVRRKAQRNNEAENEVPIYEIPYEYSFLKKLSNKIELAIPRVFKEKDNNDKISVFEQSPYIITGQFSELNANSGPIPYISETDNYIAFDTLFVYLIKRLSIICSHLFHQEKKINFGIKILMYLNFKKDYDFFYKYFRDVFYHSMLYGYGKNYWKDENIVEILAEEILENSTGFLPLEITKLYKHKIHLMSEAMGLFIMGHEYSHIILRHNENEITQQQEFEADALGLELMWGCIQHEQNQDTADTEELMFYFVGIEIILNWMHIVERMRDVLNDNKETIATNTHPPAKKRMEHIRQSIYSLWEKNELLYYDLTVLDTIDYIFQMIGDRLINELSNNKYIRTSHQSKEVKEKLNIEELLKYAKSMDEFRKGEIIKTYENILNQDQYNIKALLRLGIIYYKDNHNNEALQYFLKIRVPSEYKIVEFNESELNNYLTDNIEIFEAAYYVGIIYTLKVAAILQNNDNKLNEKIQKKIDILWDVIISNLELASKKYTHNGYLYYCLGTAYIMKENYKDAMQCVNELRYKYNINEWFDLQKSLLSKLSDIFNISFKNIDIKDVTRAARKGDSVEKLKLGIIYEYGINVPVNLKKAFYWYKKAAKNGITWAQIKLGDFFDYAFDRRRNIKKAIYWYTKAAEKNIVYLYYKIGTLYLEINNLFKSITWLKKASDLGNLEAKETLREIEKNTA
jgi:hypothetical protein